MAKQMNGIITTFVAVLVGLTFIGAMAGMLNPATDWSSVTNETQDISAARINGDQINDSYTFYVDYDLDETGNSPIRNFVLGNSTDDATITTDYTVNLTEGSYQLENSTFWINSDNTSYADYEYKASGYLENNLARTISGLILGFAALILLAVIVSVVMNIFGNKESVY